MSCCASCAVGGPCEGGCVGGSGGRTFVTSYDKGHRHTVTIPDCGPAHFGAEPGGDDYLGPLRNNYPPLYAPYGWSIFGQIAAPFGIRAGVMPIGAGDHYGGPLYYGGAFSYFGERFGEHVQRGRALAAQARGRGY